MIDFKDLDNSSSEDKKKPPQSNVSFSEAAAGHEKKLFDKSAEDKIGTALYGKACGYLGKVFSAVGKDAGFSLEPGFQLVRSMVDNQSSSAALFIAALHRDDPDNFIINHCVNTTVFAIKMGVNLGFSHERQVEIGLAALLHDVGKLILGSFVKKELAQIEAMVTKGIAFDVAESIVLGTNHAEVGGQILHKWSFPAELVNAVQWHHDPESCENTCILSDIVHVANKVGLMTGFGKVEGEIDIEPFGPVVDRLGLKTNHLKAMAQQTLQELEKLSDLWDMP